MIKIGIFGGAFNPIHNGHTGMAREAFTDLKLDKMLIIPTAKPPHKDTELLPFEQRAKMCELAFSDMIEAGKAEVCDIEKRMGGTSYTILTVRELRRSYPSDVVFYLLIGGDMLFCFDKWYKYESLLGECKVTAAARQTSEYADMCEYANEIGRIKVLNLSVREISSTEVREKLKSGEDVSQLLDPSVYAYIKEHKLYE